MDISKYIEQQKLLLKQEKMRLFYDNGASRKDDCEKNVKFNDSDTQEVKDSENFEEDTTNFNNRSIHSTTNSFFTVDVDEESKPYPKPNPSMKDAKDVSECPAIHAIHINNELSNPNSPTNCKYEKDKNDMEQWVTDTFFLNFPSLNKNAEEKKLQMRARQTRDYQEYLSNLPAFSTKRKFEPKLYKSNEIQSADIYVHDNSNNLDSPLFKRAVDVNNHQPEVRKDSPRHRQLENLKHVDLPAIVNTDTVHQLNQQIVQKESQKKMDYQQELIKQIEEKRREVESLRAKEKQEEELLTRRLEHQLKTIELEEELEKEKQRSEKIRLANEQNHIRRMQLLSKLENDHKLYNPYDPHNENRKSLSENGKDVYLHPGDISKNDPNKVYRYFSNSAKYDHKLKRYGYGEFGYDFDKDNQSDDEFGGIVGAEPLDLHHNFAYQNDHRYQYCRRCRSDITESFLNAGKQKREDSSSYCLNCHLKVHHLDNLCLECSHKLEKLPHHCQNCSKVKDLCLSCNKNSKYLCKQCANTNNNLKQIKEAANENLLETEYQSYRILDVQYHRPPDELDDDSDTTDNNVYARKPFKSNYSKPPFSYNVEKESIFNPHKKIVEPKLTVNIKNGEIYVDRQAQDPDDDNEEAVKQKTEERILRYVKNYDDLRTTKNRYQQPKPRVEEQKSRNRPNVVNQNLKVLPRVKYPRIYTVTEKKETTRSEVGDVLLSQRSQAIRNLERKWDVPAIKKTTVSNTPASNNVLTQLGAIKKQLQLEQLQME